MIIVELSLITALFALIAYLGFKSGSFEILSIISVILSGTAGLIVLGMLGVCIIVHIPMVRKNKLIEYQQTYSVISQMIASDHSAVLTLTSQIAEYNTKVLTGRMMQDSKHFSILDYDFYYDLPLIELNSER